MSAPSIVSCELEFLSRRYAPEQYWTWPGGRYEGWTSAFVRLTGDNGTVGYGEIGDGLNVRDMIRPAFDWAASRVIGQPAEPRGVIERLTRAAPGWGHGGLYQSVISGIEIASFDLLGRALGVPAHVLLGGAFRRQLPVYASGGIAADPSDLAAEMTSHVAAGFKAVKMRIGFGADIDEGRVAAAREALGDDVELMLDLGASYLPDPPDVRTVVELSERLDRYRPYWLEDPLPRDDVNGHAMLRRELSTRIAMGENERTFDLIRRMLDAGAVDIVQSDAVYMGGILRQMEVAALAQAAGARLAPHTWCSGPGVMANLTVVAAAPAACFLELPRVPNDLREGTMAQPLAIENGFVALPETPGLGVEFSDEVRGWTYDPEAGPRLANA